MWNLDIDRYTAEHIFTKRNILPICGIFSNSLSSRHVGLWTARRESRVSARVSRHEFKSVRAHAGALQRSSRGILRLAERRAAPSTPLEPFRWCGTMSLKTPHRSIRLWCVLTRGRLRPLSEIVLHTGVPPGGPDIKPAGSIWIRTAYANVVKLGRAQRAASQQAVTTSLDHASWQRRHFVALGRPAGLE
jgi:hypothetical protein